MKDKSPREPMCDVVLVGPLPPPMNGMTVMTAYALAACRGSALRIVHFDMSDHRHVGNIGRLDTRNVFLALSQALGLLRATWRTRPRLVVLPIAQSNLGALRDAALFLAVRAGGAKPLVYLHGAAFGDYYSRAGRLMQWIIRRCFGAAHGGIVLTPSTRSVFGSLLASDRVWVVPNGIPDAPRVSNGRGHSGRVTVLCLSNLSSAKGYRDALLAAAQVAAARDDVRFVFAGAWSRSRERDWAEEVVRRLGLSGKVEFRGHIVGLRKVQLLQGTDILCFTPRVPEGQPVVILEAMRHGIPCVVTPQGGIVDTVIDGVTGTYVVTASPESIAQGVLRLAGDCALRERMGASARKRYEEEYTMRRYGEALTASLRSAISKVPVVGSAAIDSRSAV